MFNRDQHFRGKKCWVGAPKLSCPRARETLGTPLLAGHAYVWLHQVSGKRTMRHLYDIRLGMLQARDSEISQRTCIDGTCSAAHLRGIIARRTAYVACMFIM